MNETRREAPSASDDGGSFRKSFTCSFLNTVMPGLPVVGFQEHSGPEYEGGDEGEEGHSQNTTGQNYQLHLCTLL